MGSLLPDILTPGTVLRATTGITVKVLGTSKRDDFGQRLYRLRYSRHSRDGWVMPEKTSSQTYSRDDLQAAGFVREEW
jgi:hypothetical protein